MCLLTWNASKMLNESAVFGAFCRLVSVSFSILATHPNEAWVYHLQTMLPNQHVFSPPRHSVFRRGVCTAMSVSVCDSAARDGRSKRMTSIRAAPSHRPSPLARCHLFVYVNEAEFIILMPVRETPVDEATPLHTRLTWRRRRATSFSGRPAPSRS